MADPRIAKLAKILTDYSIKIKKGDIIELTFDINAAQLALECYKNILKKGAYPAVHTSPPGFGYAYYKNATEEQLMKVPEIALFEAKLAAGSISISAPENTREFTGIDPKRMAIRSKATHPVSELFLKKNNWVGTDFPSSALAQEADMSLEEYEDFFFNATNIDYIALSKKQDNLKRVLDKGKQVRLVAPDTDLRFSIAGRTAIKCDGKRNVPDGEVFIAPVETSTEGYITYTYPAIKGGREVDGVRLEFKNGAVVKATAKKNEAFLKQMIATDKGSKFLGEFGVGMSPNITKFTKNILFDEKLNFTIHLALGMAYKEGGGKNDSALHWDMIKDLRNGAIYIDGKCIQKNGKWLIKL
jgi:aminopeptidase